MQQNRLDGLRVAIILSDDFEQAEMTEPRKATRTGRRYNYPHFS